MTEPRRRVDDRINELWDKMKTASDADVEPLLRELLQLTRKKAERLKRRAAKLLLKGERPGPDRRNLLS